MIIEDYTNTSASNAVEAGMNTGEYIVTLSVNGKSIQANKIVRLAQQYASMHL